MGVEILVYAGASTSFQADSLYKKQAEACLTFKPSAILSDSPVLLGAHTLPQKVDTNTDTPSTTRSDKSDVVVDSQRHAPSTTQPDFDALKSRLGTFEKELLSSSDAKLIYHQTHLSSDRTKACRDPVAGAARPTCSPLGTDSAISKQHGMINHLLDFSHITDYMPTEVANPSRPSTEYQQIEKSLEKPKEQYQDSAILDRPPTSQSVAGFTNMTPLQAILHRERTAMIRRKENYRGLERSVLLTDTTSIISGSPTHSIQGDRMSVTDTTTLRTFHEHVLSDSSLLLPPRCVNRYITIPTDQQHGFSKTPTTEEHSSHSKEHPSHSIEQDLSPVRPSVQPTNREGSNLAESCPEDFEMIGEFTLKQHNSPFYTSTKYPECSGLCSSQRLPSNMSNIPSSIDRSMSTEMTHLAETCARNSTAPEMDHGIEIENEEHILQGISSNELQTDYDGNCRKRLSRMTDFSPEASVKKKMRLHNRTLTLMASQEQVRQLPSKVVLITDDLTHRNDRDNFHGHHQQAQVPHNVVEERSSIREQPSSKLTGTIKSACCTRGDQLLGRVLSFSLDVPGVNSEPPLFPEYLVNLKVPSKMKRQVRDVRPLERGFWQIKLGELQFTQHEFHHLWSGLANIVQKRKLYWISLYCVEDTLRVYCHGQCVKQIWVVIYALSKRIKNHSLWIDARGQEVLFI